MTHLNNEQTVEILDALDTLEVRMQNLIKYLERNKTPKIDVVLYSVDKMKDNILALAIRLETLKEQA